MKRSEFIKGFTRNVKLKAKISPRELKQLSKLMEQYIDLLLQLESSEEEKYFLDEIDFPEFVAGLINGVFEAILDVSIQQMEDYEKLLKEVTKSIDQFIQNIEQDNNAFDYLAGGEEDDFFVIDNIQNMAEMTDCEKLKRILTKLGINLVIDCPPTDQQRQAAQKAITVRKRQKLLSNMVLMGINRIVITDGKK